MVENVIEPAEHIESVDPDLLTPVLFSSPEEDRGSGWRMMDDKKTKAVFVFVFLSSIILHPKTALVFVFLYKARSRDPGG